MVLLLFVLFKNVYMWHTLFEMGNDGRLWTMFKMDLENVQNKIRSFVQHVGNNCCNQEKTSSGVITYTAPTEHAEERCSIQFDDETTKEDESQPSLEQNVAVQESPELSIELAEGYKRRSESKRPKTSKLKRRWSLPDCTTAVSYTHLRAHET